MKSNFTGQSLSSASRAITAHSGSNALAQQPAQMIRAGVVPTVSNAYRNVTTIHANPSFAAIEGNKAFNKSQRDTITDNNENQSGDAFVKKISRPLEDDTDKTALLAPDRARTMYPEVDHIVPKDENGANDVRNARVLSKGNNNSPAVTRPPASSRSLTVYENVTINGTAYNAGDMVSGTDLNKAKTVYGKGGPSGVVNAISGKAAGTIATDTA